MKGFDIQINGKVVCAAGGPPNTHLHVSASKNHDDLVYLYVNGTTTANEYKRVHLNWGNQTLNVGDTLVVSVVDRPKFDAPLDSHAWDPTESNASEEKMLDLMARYRVIAEMDGTDALKEPKEEGDFCSFCGKSKEEQPKMCRGPGDVRICIECVSRCNDIFVSGGTWPRG